MALRLELPGTPGRLPDGPARPAAPFARGLIDLSWTACDRSLHVNGPPRVHEHNGIARSYTAGSSQYSTRTNVQGIGSDATLLWWGYVDGTTGANRTLMAVNASGSTRYVQYVDTVGNIRVWAAGGTTQNGTATGVSATTGALVCYVARCTPTFRELSLNGSQIATNSTNVGTVTGINRVSVGADVVSGSPSGYLTGRCLLRAVWNRYITDAELVAVGKNPLRLIETRRIWVPVSVAAGVYTLTASSGAYTLTGQAAALTATRAITAEQGTYTLTGQAAGLLASYSLPAAQGSYTLSGQDATLTYTPAGAYSLTAAAGTYTLTGQDAALLALRSLSAEQGAYTLTGQDATLARQFTVTADSGSYSLTGQAATLTRTIIMTADGGTYVLTGQAATLTYSGEAVAAQLSAAPIGHGPALGMRSLHLGRRMANISRRTR